MGVVPREAPSRASHRLPSWSGAHILVRALQRHGVQVMFGQSLPSALHLVAPEFGIRQIAYRTENAGASMADGYARVSHKVGVVTAQNGPAAALLVSGLSEALKASVPIVALVQDVARAQTDRNAFQDLDHPELFRACSKWVRRVSDLTRIDDYVDMAFTAAASGRPGPAVLLCPRDLLQETGRGEPPAVRRRNLGSYPLDRAVADPARVAQAAAMLASARSPLIVAGGGVHLSEAHAELAHLQQTASIPVATTSMGKGAVDERHPLSVGVIGYFMGTRSATKAMRRLVADADVILFVGDRTNQNGTDSWTLFPPGASYIHLDIDGQEVGRNYEALRLVGDAKLTLAALADAVRSLDLGARTRNRGAVEATIAEGRGLFAEEAREVMNSSQAPLRPERLMRDLNKVLTPDTIVVSDASYSAIWTANYLVGQAAGMRFLSGRGLAGLGWGLPAAMGAKVAAPERTVVCLAGDGAFAHMWCELESAKRLGVEVVLIVLNNQILAYQWHAEDVQYGAHTDAVQLAPVDHAAIARACGCEGIRVEQAADFQPALERALKAPVTTVIDVLIDPKAYPPITVFEGKLPA